MAGADYGMYQPMLALQQACPNLNKSQVCNLARSARTNYDAVVLFLRRACLDRRDRATRRSMMRC